MHMIMSGRHWETNLLNKWSRGTLGSCIGAPAQLTYPTYGARGGVELIDWSLFRLVLAEHSDGLSGTSLLSIR